MFTDITKQAASEYGGKLHDLLLCIFMAHQHAQPDTVLAVLSRCDTVSKCMHPSSKSFHHSVDAWS